MVKHTHELQLANFICRFGEKKLLDYVEQIVIPAFVGDNVRRFGQSKYLFNDVQLVSLDPGKKVVGLVGRFIKDTELRREQYLENGVLIRDQKSLQSSPTAIFLLLLNPHRLMFVTETSYAPNLSAFSSTCYNFLKKSYLKFIENEYMESIERGEKITKKALRILHASPTLNIVPLSSDDDLRNFIFRFSILRRIKIDILQTNDEFDANDLLETIRGQSELLKGKKASLIHESKDGLDKDSVADKFSEITFHGNHRLSLSGTDDAGGKLTGNNHDFSFRIPVYSITGSMAEKAMLIYRYYQEQLDSGLIREPLQSKSNPKSDEIFKKHFQ